MVRALRLAIRDPQSAWLAMHIGLFIVCARRRLARQSLPQFIATLRHRGFMRVPRASSERIVGFRSWWLRLPALQKCDTCYVRAMTLYRFLDAPDRDLQLHIGIEKRESDGERLRGHAWVSLADAVIEGPAAVLEGRIREIALPRSS